VSRLATVLLLMVSLTICGGLCMGEAGSLQIKAETTETGFPLNLSQGFSPRFPAPELRDAAGGVEEFCFLIKDFKIDHQSEINNLNITIRYEYSSGIDEASYPDFRLIARDIETLLSTYPNERDYWEVLNKRVTSMVLDKYRSIRRVSSQIEVSPSARDPYNRASLVTCVRRAAPKSMIRH